MSASSATKKTVYLIRHAQSTHNEFALTWKETDQWADPMHVDAKLSKLGQSQVEQLREKAKELTDIELIVVSPLSRALITCSVGLEHHIKEKKVTDGKLEFQPSLIFT
jgi:broad specificity phosphatase PhoE